ncbi:MAG: hypothetical protein DI536_36430 [Archangium gephyra]|uniref:VapC45 PIN like domain-containing protein n=1 Tax=Archangium gephyra TaxID=48 RepID=A0A2W5UID8_9BACT|nr:MAG: hypothetical protein DI536_36430 [Archangium gephyra]
MPSPRFLLDRSLGGRKLVTALRDAEWDAVTLAEHFGETRAQEMRDEEWISEGTAAGFVLIAKDHHVATRPLEALAIYMHNARVVTFARGDITAEDMVALCLKFNTQIHRLATVTPPFVMSLSQHGLRRKHLNSPTA